MNQYKHGIIITLLLLSASTLVVSCSLAVKRAGETYHVPYEECTCVDTKPM